LDADLALQDTQIARQFEKGASLDRLKEREPMRSKNELAQFCPSWLPISPNATHWDPRLAGFPAIHVTNLRNLRLKNFKGLIDSFFVFLEFPLFVINPFRIFFLTSFFVFLYSYFVAKM